MSEEEILTKTLLKTIKHLEKQLDEKQDAVNISLSPNNQRTDKKEPSLLLIIIKIH